MRTMRIGGRFVRGLWFEPGGTLFVAGGNAEGLAAVYSCRPEEGVSHFVLHLHAVRQWAVSADRRLLATVGQHILSGQGNTTFELRCYELGPWAAPLILVTGSEGAREAPRGLAFMPDGKMLAGLMFGSGGTRSRPWAGIHFWDTASGKHRREWPSPMTWDGLAFAPAGNWFVTWGEGRLALWSLPEGNRLGAVDALGHTSAGVTVSPDGRWLAELHELGVTLWRVPGLEPHATLTGHVGEVTAAEFSPDGRTLLTAGVDGTVRIWDVESIAERQTLAWGVGTVGAVGWAADGLTAAAGGEGGQVVVWDVA